MCVFFLSSPSRSFLVRSPVGNQHIVSICFHAIRVWCDKVVSWCYHSRRCPSHLDYLQDNVLRDRAQYANHHALDSSTEFVINDIIKEETPSLFAVGTNPFFHIRCIFIHPWKSLFPSSLWLGGEGEKLIAHANVLPNYHHHPQG